MVNIESTNAIRSKKNAKGVNAYIKPAASAAFLDLKSRNERYEMPNNVPRPENTETSLPAIKWLAMIFRNGITIHIKRGSLPSERGRNRRVSSAFIIWAQRI